MDVIGNNIANVNTVGYKFQSMNFSDMLYQTTSAASGPNAATGTGGVNARQIGLGSKTAAITTAITQAGAAQTTNNPFDIYITGESFFVVSDGSDTLFTRDGSFAVDAVGNLVMSSNGYNVMGWLPDTEDPNSVKKVDVKPLNIMGYSTFDPEATTLGYATGIIDSNDTNVNSQAGKVINLKFYDKKGYSYTAKFTVSNNGITEQGTFALKLDSIVDSSGVKLTDNPATSIGGNTANQMYIHFDKATGSFLGIDTNQPAGTTLSDKITLDFANTNATDAQVNFEDLEIDFSELSNVNNDGSSTVSLTSGASGKERSGGLAPGQGRGRKRGNMTGVSITNNGSIYATYDNGQSRLLGQIAAASFANAMGLEKAGDNLYKQSQNSGTFDGIGVDVTADGGYFTTGELEMSNVDLSNELTTMIVTQRGFQANSRIITVSDTMLEELVNLKR
jgi:flagellar hook protein FlgE